MKIETKSKKKLNPRVDPQTDMLIDLVHEMIGEPDALDLDGTEPVSAFQEYSIEEDESNILESEDDLLEAFIMLRSGRQKR